MKRLFKNSEAGFTLMETIVALGLGFFVMITIMAVVIPGLEKIRDINRIEQLHVNAVFLLNTLTYWIKQAENLSVLNPSKLEIRLSGSPTPKIVSTDANNNITIDDVPFNTGDIEVTGLSFIPMARSVRISFTIKTKEGETLPITTTIAKRNNF